MSFQFSGWLDQQLSGILLKNRTVALHAVTLVDRVLHGHGWYKRSYWLTQIKIRAFVGRIALLLEHGRRTEADALIFGDKALYVAIPDLFVVLITLLLDKKYQLDRLCTYFSQHSELILQQLPVTHELVCRMLEARLLSGMPIADDLLSLVQKPLSASSLNTVFRMLKLSSHQVATDGLMLLRRNPALTDMDRLLADYEWHKLHNSPQAIVQLAPQLLLVVPNRIDVWKTTCASCFLTEHYELLQSYLDELLRLCQERIRQQGITGEESFLIQLGLLFYNYGLLPRFRRVAQTELNLIRQHNFSASFIRSGVIPAYTVLHSAIAGIMSNYHGLQFSLLQPEQIASWRNKKLLFIGNVNALCNQLMFSAMFTQISQDFSGSLVCCDSRLIEVFQRSFPELQFLPIDKKQARHASRPDSQKMLLTDDIETIAKTVDLVTAMPFQLYFQDEHGLQQRRSKGPWLKPDLLRSAAIKNQIGREGKVLVGISVGSGHVTFERLIYRLDHTELKQLSLNFKQIVFVNLDYQHSPADVAELAMQHDLPLVSPSLDLKDDLDGVLSLIDALDLVITTPNSLMDMCASVGKPTLVIDLSCQMREWENQDTGSYIYSEMVRFVRPSDDRKSARQQVLDELMQKLTAAFESQ